MKNHLYVDFHVIQTVPPSCVNRDDTGSPKTAIYGGTTRSRISSQSWKRAIRLYFKEHCLEKEIGIRTKYVIDLLKEKIVESGDFAEEKAEELAVSVLKAVGIIKEKKEKPEKEKEKKEKPEKTKIEALFFISPGQVDALTKLAVEFEKRPKEERNKAEEKAELQKALKEYPAIDIALFGRMVASDPSLNFDAACQIAHAISTHTVHNEYDYFTAVDDCAPEDNAGAGHLGTIEYNSSTLYRYATINVTELQKYLLEDAAEAVREFAEAFVCSMPTGKQNTFANRTLPDAVYVTVRTDQPINMVGAFEKPIIAKANGYVEASKQAFEDYVARVYDTFADAPEKAWIVGDDLEKLGENMSFKSLLNALYAYVEEKIEVTE